MNSNPTLFSPQIQELQRILLMQPQQGPQMFSPYANQLYQSHSMIQEEQKDQNTYLTSRNVCQQPSQNFQGLDNLNNNNYFLNQCKNLESIFKVNDQDKMPIQNPCQIFNFPVDYQSQLQNQLNKMATQSGSNSSISQELLNQLSSPQFPLSIPLLGWSPQMTLNNQFNNQFQKLKEQQSLIDNKQIISFLQNPRDLSNSMESTIASYPSLTSLTSIQQSQQKIPQISPSINSKNLILPTLRSAKSVNDQVNCRSSSQINSKQCMVEESEEIEMQIHNIPAIKKEHLSEDEDFSIQNSGLPSLCKINSQNSQIVGKISATLMDRKARLKQNLKNQNSQEKSFSFHSKNQLFPQEGPSLESQSLIKNFSNQFEIFDEQEGDLEKSKRMSDHQQQLLNSLGKQYQIQQIFSQQMQQQSEFQSPTTPIQRKNMMYINPLCKAYEGMKQVHSNESSNSSTRELNKIKDALFSSQSPSNFKDLPSEHKDIFQDNLTFLVDTINKQSLIRQNSHLLYGKFNSSSESTPSDSTQLGSFSPSFELLNYKNSLKKIDSIDAPQNYSTASSLNNLSSMISNFPKNSMEEEQSPDLFSESRKRQTSSFSMGQNMLKSQTSPQMRYASLNSPQGSNQNNSERTLLNLYSAPLGKDRERSKQFATAKNTQGNRLKQSIEASSPSTVPILPLLKRSKYHNLTKLFMYFLLSLFQPENMQRLKIPDFIQQELIKCVQNVKKTAKKKIKNKNLQKTDFFNHTHYNVLFLHLNKNSLRELQKKEKDIHVHYQCFGLDLQNIDVQRLEYVNILKKFAFEIVINTLEAPSEAECLNNPRNEYMLKAISGIRQLAQGHVIFRFQQVYVNHQEE